MLQTRVIPCLLLQGRGLVKTQKFKSPQYVGDPINAVKIFNDKEVDELLFLDITATIEGREPNTKVIAEIASECFMPLGYGGGIRTTEQIREIFSLGVEKVAINSASVENPRLIREAAETFGSQSIVASIDIKRHFFGKYRVHIHGGRTNTGLDPVAHAQDLEQMGVGEIFINSIDRDGTGQGYDLALIEAVASRVRVPVVASGGAAGLDDFRAAIQAGASAIAAGSFFVFHGKHRAVLISYPTQAELKKRVG